MITIEAPDGALYLPASAVRHRPGYEDVTPALLATWRTAGHLKAVTTAELAAAFGRTLPAAGVDPDAAAMWPGPSGPEYLFRWADVVTAETRTRRTRRTRGGRARRTTPRVCTP